ncbi:hypothetical protein BX616_005928, partial [Lobosporangium transversale]
LLKSRRFSLVIITARQQFVADLTKKFVDRHFPGIFESIYFANHFLTEQEKLTFISKPKSVICRDVHAQLLIDDSLENAIEVAKAGVPVLLFDLNGKYKWNKLPEGQDMLPEKITRVHSWKDIQAWFPRPRSPLSTLCLSRDDQVSEEEEEGEGEDDGKISDSEDEEMDEDEILQQQQQHLYYGHQHHRNIDSDSDSDEDDMIVKREQEDIEEEEEDQHSGRTLRRRKLTAVDFSSSEEDEDIDLKNGRAIKGDSMDSDFDLESGHGVRHISHEELERYRHQHEIMNVNESTGMEVEMETTINTTASFAQITSPTMSTTTTTMSGQVSIAAATALEVNCQSFSEASATVTIASTSLDAMAVEGLSIKSPPHQVDSAINMEMEDVPLS